MWTEIKLSELQASEATARQLLQKFIDAQALMNAHYAGKFTKESVRDMLERKTSLDMRLFYYDDGETACTMALKKNGKGELRLLTTACAKGDVEKAADIVQAALKKAMARVGVTSCYAIWGATNYDAGNLYFWAFVERCKTNFSQSENVEYEPGKYKLWMSL